MSTGVTSYVWAAEANRILVPLDGALYVLDGVDEAAAPPRRLFDPADARWAAVGSGPLLDAKISADGSLVCFVWADEVCCCAVPAGAEADAATPRRLTSGARGEGKTNGLADYCAQEEMDRYVGFWLSPDAATLAYEEVDERHIPHYRIARHATSPHEEEEFRYPFAGAANPKVRLGWTSTKEGEGGAAWFDLTGPYGDDFYLARVDWAHDGTLLAQVQSRDQRDLTILRLDPATGSATPLHREHNDAWVNLHDMLRPLKSGGFLWASEQDGWRHLWVHGADGKPSRRLTSGEWLVEEIAAVDEANGYVYYLGTQEGHLQRHLYRVRLAEEEGGVTSSSALLTKEGGYHAGVAVARDGSRFVDQYHSTSAPAVATLCALPSGDAAANTAPVQLYSAASDPRVDAMAAMLRPPRLVSLPSTDGSTTLEAAFYAPDEKLFGEGPYPTVVSCYGGPHVQFVADSWVMTADLRAQFLRSQGFLVIKCDNRGSDRRGLPFEASIQGKLGQLEVDDQVAAVRFAVAEGLADPSRVGIYGWSYGGYLSAMCLAKAPDVFRCAVSGAPVTSWDGYDTHYTERYMGGTPEQMPDAYTASSVMAHVDGIQGALLLVHGLVDENVHFRHTARLAQAMVDAQKAHELLTFPNERHSPRSQKDRTFMEQRVFAFLHRWLA